MAIMGTCKKCGCETIDYCCGACDSNEISDLQWRLSCAVALIEEMRQALSVYDGSAPNTFARWDAELAAIKGGDDG